MDHAGHLDGDSSERLAPEVRVVPVALERLSSLLPPDRVERLEQHVLAARRMLGDRTVWNINSTARGGGVAEMLHGLVAYAAGTGIDVRWLHRGGTPPGESTLLVDAVAALERPPGDDVFAWVGAESATVRAVRADLRGRWGLGRSQHHAIGYWRLGRAMGA